MFDDQEKEMSQWFIYNYKNVYLVKGNPLIPGGKNGYSLVNKNGSVLDSELSWYDLVEIQKNGLAWY